MAIDRSRVAALALMLAAPVPGQVASQWVRKQDLLPTQRALAVASDPVRRRLVLFGGGFGPEYGTWEFDGAAWSPRFPAAAPPDRWWHGMVWDAARQRVVLFGGTGGPGVPTDDTWEWDGRVWSRIATRFSPSPRRGHAMAFDAARGHTIVFGGSGDLGALARLTQDTLAYDGTTWTTVASSGPSPRAEAAMTYDPARQRVLLFGGRGVSGISDETWVWDGATWMQLFPATRPPTRADAAMVWDPGSQRVLMFGGMGVGAPLDDTWEWDGVDWTERSGAVHPETSGSPVLAFDAARGRVVLMGEDSDWGWDGATWTPLATRRGVPPLFYGQLVYDSTRARVVMVQDDTFDNKMAAWDGRHWSVVGAALPGRRERFAATYDAARDRVVVFGGYNDGPLGGTWEWDGVTWTPASAGPQPSAREQAAMVYDSARQCIVLFGGHDFGYYTDTWERSGTTWRLRPFIGGPGGRVRHGMAYDVARQRTVMFGGSRGAISDPRTWEWDGTAWTATLASPHPPSDVMLTYDTARGRVTAAGRAAGTATFETWEWDGVAWTQIAAPLSPPLAATWFDSMVYHVAAERAVVIAAEGSSYDTWVFGATAPASALPYGSPCGSGGLVLDALGVPSGANASFALDVYGASAAAPAAYLFGASAASVPLAGCTLLVEGGVVALPATTSPAGFDSLPLPIPPQAHWFGSALFAQAVVIDPAAARGLAFSNGLALRIGD
jgi:hypothetical protein